MYSLVFICELIFFEALLASICVARASSVFGFSARFLSTSLHLNRGPQSAFVRAKIYEILMKKLSWRSQIVPNVVAKTLI